MTQSILLISAGIFHPPYSGREALRTALQPLKEFTFRPLASLDRLPARLDGVAALVLYFHHQRLSPAALERLDAFVVGGGGVLAIHSATASFKDVPRYFEILGGRFVEHGPVAEFEVRRQRADLFTDVDTFTVKDELYIHELQPDIEVHFTARHLGQDVPVVWTRRHGAGRVCYAVPGHLAASLRHPAVQAILRRGLRWAGRSESG